MGGSVLNAQHGSVLSARQQPVTYNGNEPADNSSETVFIPGFANLEKKIAAANRVRIEVNVHDQGVLMAEFDVSGYKPEKLRPSK